MAFNVSGQEVATGAADPAQMFTIVAILFGVGFVVLFLIYLHNVWGNK